MWALIALVSFYLITFSNRGIQQAYAAAGINRQINFQGKLVNPDGTNVTDGSYSIVFTLYNAASAGSSLWTETQSVTLSNGIFQVNLGTTCLFNTAAACNNNTPVDFNSDQLYLGIKVGSDAEMTPRIQFTAVPQAFNSEKLNGLTSSQFARTDANNTLTGTNSIQNTSATALVVQRASAGAVLFQADTLNQIVGVGSAPTSGGATLQVNGSVSLTTLGSANSVTYLCRNSATNQIATCQTNVNGSAFVQGGNSFGATATLGTTDANQLTLGTFNGTALQQRINITNTVSSTANATLTFTGASIFKPNTDSATAWQVQNANGAPILLVDTTSTDATGTNLNLLTYPGFEVGNPPTGWSAVAPGTIAQNLNKSNTYYGYASLALTTTTSNGGASTTNFTQSVGAGTYTVSFYVKPSVAMNASGLTITLNDGTARTCSPAAATLSTTGFIRVSCTPAALTGTLTSLTIGQNDNTARTIYIDAVQLQSGATATPYQIGSVQIRGVVTNPITLQNLSNSTTAFQVQNAAGTGNNFVVDTLNSQAKFLTAGYGANFNAGGTATFRTTTNSASGFQIQNTSAVPLFNVDTTQSVNKLTNGSLENGTSGWANIAGGTLTQVTGAGQSLFGQAGGQIAGTAANGGARTTGFIATQGAGAYTLSFYAKATGSNFSTLAAGYNQGAGDVACTLSDTTVVTGGFKLYSCSFTTTANMASVWIEQTDAATRNFYIDGVQLQSGSNVLPYNIGAMQLSGIINSAVTIQTSSDATNVFQIQNSAGTSNLFVADTLNNTVGITGKATFTQNAGDQLKVIANTGQVPSADMVSISNSGNPITTAGINGLQLDYYANLGVAANESSAQRVNITNTSATSGTITNGLRVVAAGAVAGTTNGLKIDGFTSGAGGASALYIGSGWKDLLNYNGAQLISGAGILQSAGFSGTYSNALTFSNASNSFTGNGAGLTSLSGSNISSGTVGVGVGGTGLASYTTGDLLYASGSTTIGKLADVATGSCLTSGGVGVAPTWGSCSGGAVSGTVNTIAMFTGSGTTVGNSILSQSSTTLTAAGNLVVNAANGFSGNILDLQVNAGSKFSVNQTGATTVAGLISANGGLTVAANQNVTLSSGTGTFSQTYSGTATGTTNVQSLSVTNGNAGASAATVNAQSITLVGTATSGGINVNNAISFANPSSATNNSFYGLNFAGTGYTAVLRVNNNNILDGSGIIQNAAFATATTYSNLQKVGSLTATTLAATNASGLTLGATGSATGSILFKGATGGSGTLTVTSPANPTTNTLTLPNETGTLCSTGSVCAGYAPATGSGSYVQLQASTPGSAQTGNVNISGTGIFGTAVTAAGSTLNGTALNFGANADSTIQVNANTTADAVGLNLTMSAGAANGSTTGNLGGTLTLQGGAAAGSSNNNGGNLVLSGGAKTGTGVAGSVIVRPPTDTVTALQVQNAASSAAFNVDTTNTRIGIGNASPSEALHISVATNPVIRLENTAVASNSTTSGPNNPSTAGNDASTGTVAWSNTGNIFTSNDSRASVNYSTFTSSNYLTASGFSFSIPSNATIVGISTDTEFICSYVGASNMAIRSIKAGTISSTERAFSSACVSGTSDSINTTGGSTDLWSDTWAPSDINSSNFGMAVRTTAGRGVSTTWQIDTIGITVYYTTPGLNWAIGSQSSTGKFKISNSSVIGGADRLSIDGTGNVIARGTITGSASPDIAETITAAPDVEAMDVVSIDPDKSESAIKSRGAYDSAVLGVIAKEGTSSFLINAHSADVNGALTGKPLVLAGRVPVKVTDENGSIKPGDYLAASSKPGYAMKATKPGTTIGKSLGYFDADSGIVMAQIQVGYYDAFRGSDYIQAGGSAELSSLSVNGTANFLNLNVSGPAYISSLTVEHLQVTGDMSVDGNLTVQGLLTTVDLQINGHIITAGSKPTVSWQTAAGLGAVYAVNGNDTSGILTITTGNLPGSGDLLKFIFSKGYTSIPKVLISPSNDQAAGLRFYRGNTTLNDVLLRTIDVPKANTTYQFDYFIAQ